MIKEVDVRNQQDQSKPIDISKIDANVELAPGSKFVNSILGE